MFMQYLIRSKSQEGQENFVILASSFKRNGTYLEIGASDGYNNSNTLILEKVYGYTGIGIEINDKESLKYNSTRTNLCISKNAIYIDYQKLLENYHFPEVIDYLQIDIDPAFQSLKALKKVLNSNFKFRYITFEHDLYLSQENYKIKSSAHEMLEDAGYVRYREDVMYRNLYAFEDWYINPKLVSVNRLKFVEKFVGARVIAILNTTLYFFTTGKIKLV